MALGLAGIGYIATQDDDTSTSTTNVEQTEDTAPSANDFTVSEDGKTVSYSGVTGEDALTTLQSHTEVVTETSDFGEFVTTINGVVADSSSEFWAFYVNGAQASVGADSYIATDGDTVEWKLESF